MNDNSTLYRPTGHSGQRASLRDEKQWRCIESEGEPCGIISKNSELEERVWVDNDGTHFGDYCPACGGEVTYA